MTDTGVEVAQGSADRIQSAIAEVVVLSTGIVRPRVSIGIATAQPGARIDEVMTQSDQAMYSAKHAGKGRVRVYGTSGQPGVHTDRPGHQGKPQHDRSVPRLGNTHEQPSADEVADQRARQ